MRIHSTARLCVCTMRCVPMHVHTPPSRTHTTQRFIKMPLTPTRTTKTLHWKIFLTQHKTYLEPLWLLLASFSLFTGSRIHFTAPRTYSPATHEFHDRYLEARFPVIVRHLPFSVSAFRLPIIVRLSAAHRKSPVANARRLALRIVANFVPVGR